MKRRDFLITGSLALGNLACGSFKKPKPPKPNIIVILLDTTRADALGCYGNPKPATPRLDQFAADALQCNNAYSTTSWTLPAHASLFSGLPLIRHGATQEHIYMNDTFPVLAERLTHAGYQTNAVIENPMLIAERGYNRGFTQYRETIRERRKEQSLSLGLDMFREDLYTRDASKPWFAFLNLIEPHSPYDAPEEFRQLMDCVPDNRLRDSYYIPHYLEKNRLTPEEQHRIHLEYGAEVRFVDAIVGEMLDDLEKEGILNDSLIIITSDHGEHFGEHGHMLHTYSLHQELIHIPLLLRMPGKYPQGQSTDLPLQISDLFATILDAAEIPSPVPDSIPINTLLTEQTKRPLIAEYYRPIQVLHSFQPEDRDNPNLKKYFQRMRTLIDGPFKYLWKEKDTDELYHLENDPKESTNLINDPAYAPEKHRLAQLLEDWVQHHGGEPPDATQNPEENLDPEVVESLRTLGYLP